MLWVVLLGFMTSSLLSILANHNQASNIWLDRLKNIIQSIVINSHWEPALTSAPRLGWVIGRGEPEGGKEGKVRRQSVPSLRGGGSERQTRCLVSVLTKRGIKRMKTGQFIINSQIYAQQVPPRIHRCAEIEMHGHREPLCVTALSENSVKIRRAERHSPTTTSAQKKKTEK